MLQILNTVQKIKESKSISNESVRIDSSQSNVIHNNEKTKFQNPVFKMVPLDNLQSVSENKYSHIFSSFAQSSKHEEQQQLFQQGNYQKSKQRAFSLTEPQTIKKDHKYNASDGELTNKKIITVHTARVLECIRKERDKELNAETPKLGQNQLQDSQVTVKEIVAQSQYYSPRDMDHKFNDCSSFQAKQTLTTALGSITSKSELDQILKDCQLNFEKNKAVRADEYVACLIF
ncbi:unnamed protein product (macronuclear) [Paramecium tetraurelia]|uniref:Uncharacterized protein n=1 Tax=Paramecium tetraurelia TaxID=5888 RepID=A0DRS0_PARTE|nr:uncharacterized protein GSPATT00019455001 [Paramecium tetraurelia]CAK85737.1 unnamed protein product [Paramecium tetraurelia]|eukprot:XP_001453134.1 hypothetical protein (macronuclear) [Paramecium tetraurelia strain d4-2]